MSKATATQAKKTTQNADEIAQFDALGEKWWDENGPMRPLHALNPVRMQYIRDMICKHTQRDPDKRMPLDGLQCVDIGCGGGLVAEPLCRMGAKVTGVDAGAQNIIVASKHAQAQNLKIDYRHTTAEDLAAAGETFDVVTALEIIEHVDHPDLFVESCCRLLKKDGLLILSTLNRTAKSFALGIVAAEYILRWLPRGTHEWKKFLKPSEIQSLLTPHKFEINDLCGLVYNPLHNEFSLNPNDLDVNYLLSAVPTSKC